MELVEGAKTLKKILGLDDNPFYCDPLAALDFFSMICEAIYACENASPPIVHRDLSPSNVLILPDATIKIIDFGLCYTAEGIIITLDDEGVGTPNYMSPECESGSDGNINIYSDLYSAGKLLWSAITGKFAFSREKPAFTSKTMKNMFPEAPDTWHLYHIFSRTIRHNPTDRWQSADHAISFCKRLEPIIQHGYPIIQEVFNSCPVCGMGHLEDAGDEFRTFASSLPKGFKGKKCFSCGVFLVFNTIILDNNIKIIESFE
jgi:serine/threonine protein kinase